MPNEPSDRRVLVLNDELIPQEFIIGCPSNVVAVLNVARPVRVWCGRKKGHKGLCRFKVEWMNNS